MDDVEKYGLAVEAGTMTFKDAISALVKARQGALAPLGAADLLANWKTIRAAYEPAADVLPADPAEHLAFVKQYGERSAAYIADLQFAVENNIVPVRIEQRSQQPEPGTDCTRD
ncbi:hypothetical protein [Streptomyces sp. NPDC056672]|uniref:hypothetical protein n=1 Tax=Streptomyces sp. NPDC056672 TaxID=3345906 RepID=UPI00369604C2